MTTTTKTKGAIVAHWKGFRSLDDTREFLSQLAYYHGDRTIYLALPVNQLFELSGELFAPSLCLGASNMVDVTKNHFAAPVAIEILKDAGAQFVLLGDADSRKFDTSLPDKMSLCIENGINPFLCVGETLADFHQGLADQILQEQIKKAVSNLTEKQKANVSYIHESYWPLRFADKTSVDEISKANQLLRNACIEVLGEQGNSVACFTALPPYMSDLKELPSGSSTEGFYLSKAAIVPKSLITVAPEENYQATPEAISHVQEARKKAGLDPEIPNQPEVFTPSAAPVKTASSTPSLPSSDPTPVEQTVPDKTTQLKGRVHLVENLTDLFLNIKL